MENVLQGKKIAITGTFWLQRRDLVNLLERVVGIAGEVNIAQADYLLVGKLNGTSSTNKISGAEKRGIRILNEEEVKKIVQAVESGNIEAYSSTTKAAKPTREEYLATCPETYGAW